jgi:protein-S-isoprenylcysteine O-methyltransferase Ste14
VHDPGRAATPTVRLLAWMGAGLFVLSLGYFVYSYAIVFGTPVEGALSVSRVAWDVGLFSVFALHHSVFAREAVRQRLARALGSGERSFYVWLASLLFIAVCKLWLPLPGTIWNVGGPIEALLLVLQIGGITFSVYSARVLDIWELAGIRQLAVNAPRSMPDAQDPTRSPEFEFKTTGPYGLVRHPIYLGWLLIVFPVATMTTTRFVFALVSCLYLLIAIPFEERSLRKSSGGAYDRYMQQVPRKLLPGVY